MVFLEKGNTDCLKGIFAVAILVCHLCGRTGVVDSLGVGPVYNAIGYLSVSIFFVLSGYGLAYSFDKKGNSYISGFLRNRVLTLYVLQSYLIVLYSFVTFLVGGNVSIAKIFQSFTFGGTVVSNGWYLQVILLFYLCFYVSFRWMNRPYLFMGGVTCAYILVCCCLLRMSTTWYESVLNFHLGLIVYKERNRIARLYNNCSIVMIITTVIFLLFVISFLISEGHNSLPWYVKILFKMNSAVCFSSGILLMSNIISFKSIITKWLSKYYLEIYLFQGLVFILCDNKYFQVNNPYLYFIVAFLGSIILAYYTHPLVIYLFECVKNHSVLRGK